MRSKRIYIHVSSKKDITYRDLLKFEFDLTNRYLDLNTDLFQPRFLGR